MSPEFNKDEKFQNDALFDLEFESRETKSAQYYQERAHSNVIIQQLNKNQEKEFEQKRSELYNSTSAMQNINFNLEWVQKYDPQLAAQKVIIIVATAATNIIQYSFIKFFIIFNFIRKHQTIFPHVKHKVTLI